MKVSLPIIVEEPGTLLLYASLEQAENHLEAFDVENGLYKGWDADGRILDFQVKNNEVIISIYKNLPPNPERLEGVLRSHLADVEIKAETIPAGDLSSLISEAEYFLYSPKDVIGIIKDFCIDLFVRPFAKKHIS